MKYGEKKSIQMLEAAWAEPDGFLFKLLQGQYDPTEGERFATFLNKIDLPEDAPVPRDLLALVWSIPSFLLHKKPAVIGNGGDREAYDFLIHSATIALEELLGFPNPYAAAV
jgi:hypothetical protein